jgi:hypothetical protein
MNAQSQNETLAALMFATGYGQSDTHAKILSNGKPNPHSSAGLPYSGITAREIAALLSAPPSLPKTDAQWFLPSTYLQADARSHHAQRQMGEFWWLTLDVDKNNLVLSDIEAALDCVAPGCSRLIYSTRSSTEEDRRWRALVPLSGPLAGRDYDDTQNAFFACLEDASGGVLIPDNPMARSGQIIYLPNRGAFYEHATLRGHRLALNSNHPIIQRREAERARVAAEVAEANARQQQRARERAERGNSEVSPVDQFNASHDIADLLTRYGYARQGGSDHWRSPMQTSGTFATRVYDGFWVSLSGSDAAADIGAASKGGARHGDAFDIFVHFDHGGDFTAAVRAYGEELRSAAWSQASRVDHRNGEDTGGAPNDDPPNDDQVGDDRADKAKASAGPVGSSDDPVDLWGVFPPPDLPRGLLPEVIENFARIQGEMMGADPAGLAVAALVTCAAAIPDTIKLQVKRHDPHWRESARLWAALVGSPSTKKSPILSAATAPLCRMDGEMFRAWQSDLATFNAMPKDERNGQHAPAQTRLRIEDATVEAAQAVLEGSPWGVLLLQDELSGFFGAMDKYNGGKGASADRAFWLRSFNGGEFALNRVGRGAALIPNLSVCLLGGIQPEPMRKVAGDAHDDGLLQRLFPVVLKRATIGQDAPAPDVARQYSDLVERLRLLRPPRWLGCDVIEFDEGAQTIRRDLEARHLDLQAMEAISRKLASHVGKYDGLFARLCLVWHCIECRGTELPARVTQSTAQRVSAFLHRFLLRHAAAFYGGVLGLSDDHDRLQAIAGYILTRKLERVTNRDVQRGDRTMRAIRETDIRPLLEQLASLGWLERIDGPRPSSQPYWTVNPAVHRKFAERGSEETARRENARRAVAGLMGEDDV